MLAMGALAGGLVRAQEVIVGEYHWQYDLGEDATLPAWRKFPVVKYPASFLKDPAIRYVIVVQHIESQNHQGTRGVFGGDTTAAREELIKAGPSMQLKNPAIRAGLPVESDVWFPVIFNPPAPLAPGDVPARLLQVTPAPIPFVRGKDRLPKVAVRLVITPAGGIELVNVEGGTLTEEQRRAVENAVGQWKFYPARQEDRPVFSEVVLPVAFLPVESPEDRDVQPPRRIKSARPELSTMQRLAGAHGEVRVRFAVDESGRVQGAAVEHSTNPDLNDAALAAVRQWQYQPALRRGKPVRTNLMVPVRIGTAPAGTDPGLVDEDQPGTPEAPPFDVAPRLLQPLQVLYPYEQAAKRQPGSARVTVTVGEDGRVRESRIERATDLEFGRALQAALDAIEFTPATRGPDQQRVPATLSINRGFNLAAEPGEAVTLPAGDQALLAKGTGTTAGAEPARVAGFTLRAEDRPTLKNLLKNGGWAEAEFWLESDGRPHLPRRTSYSQEILGYAALQALAGRQFESPAEPGWRRVRVDFAPVAAAAPK